MLDADAESETPNLRGVARAAGKLLEDDAGVGVICRKHFGEAFYIVARSTAPRHIPQVGVIVNAVIDKRSEPVLIDRVPEPHFCRNSVAKPAQHRQAVAAFGCGGETEQLHGIDVL